MDEDLSALLDRLPGELVRETPLTPHKRLSERHSLPVLIKDEGTQGVRSYKIRGAAAKMSSLSDKERSNGVVCASAGNHAQGVAACCNHFQVPGTVFMPRVTPQQKIDATQRHGNGFVEIILTGDTYDETAHHAHAFAEERGATYIHPFDDPEVIRGQGTVAVEVARQMASLRQKLGAVIAPVGGGGLLSGTILALQDTHPETIFIGVEPEEAPSMTESLRANQPVTLPTMDTFVDGAAVARPGDRTFAIIHEAVQRGRAQMITVNKGLLCATMADLFQIDGQVTEPAGALSIAALEHVSKELKGPTVCLLSGTNFDMRRIPSVLEHAALHRRNKVYLGIHLPNRPGALREMLDALARELEAVNITFMHFDTDQGNGDPSLYLGLESKLGHPSDITRILAALSAIRNEDASGPRYPFHELTAKPES